MISTYYPYTWDQVSIESVYAVAPLVMLHESFSDFQKYSHILFHLVSASLRKPHRWGSCSQLHSRHTFHLRGLSLDLMFVEFCVECFKGIYGDDELMRGRIPEDHPLDPFFMCPFLIFPQIPLLLSKLFASVRYSRACLMCLPKSRQHLRKGVW